MTKYVIKDVRSKSIAGEWRQFDYETAAANSRYKSVADWLREKKPDLEELHFKGISTGYHKCKSCFERGDLHIFKTFDKDKSKFKIQYAKKHFQSKAHLECGIGKIFGFSKNWRQEMDKKYLKLMATQRVSGRIFRSETFVDIIVSWVNQVTNAKIDTKTVLDQLPSPKKLYLRMHDMSKEQRG